MKWYDIVAPVYDRAIRRTYLPYSRIAVQALHLQPGKTVLDIGCGTGLNFELILNSIGTSGTLIGIDSSVKMLARARKKVEQQGWKNVHLFQQDARKLDDSDFKSLTVSRISIDSIICTLGFSVFPDWQAVFERSFDLLKNGGRYCIMDIYNNEVTLRTRIVNILAKADNSRRVWEPLRKRCDEYNEARYPSSHGDTVVIASGTKR
ncbi:MAG: class I SAM-dependent methyltransferase [Chloroflexota bacterium]